jgi:hypothetical protein
MTIAISLKVNDGLVLAADAAASIVGQDEDGSVRVIKVYEHASKIAKVSRLADIGLITWGSGGIGQASMTSLAKGLRRRFDGLDPNFESWRIDSDNHTVEQVAARAREFFFDEKYGPTYKEWPEKPSLGFLVAGYSTGVDMPEEYLVDVDDGKCVGPNLIRPKEQTGVDWWGQPEAITRLMFGFSGILPNILKDALKLSDEQLDTAMTAIVEQTGVQMVAGAMPFQDAIDLAHFLAELSINFSRFIPGPQTVGGAVQMAAIRKHEGFKWLKRSYYYPPELNS